MKTTRAVLAGLAGTAVMTTLWLVEPRIGLARFAAGDVLGSLLAAITAYTSVGPAVAWTIHFIMGMILAVVYAVAFSGRLPGSPVVRGLVYGFLLFIVAQVVFMPLVGAGLFSRGDPPTLLGSLIGHLVYGGLCGVAYGESKVVS